MSPTFLEALQINPLLLTAMLAGLLASIVSGIIGSYVVVKRITFISGSISHAILGGLGFCLWLQRNMGIEWMSPIYGAFATAILSALLIGWIHLYYKQREDSVIAAIWSVGMAVGVIFIALTPGFNVELTNFLVGNILWVTQEDIGFLSILDFIILAIVACMHKRFLAICFDEEQAQLQGIHVKALYLLLLVLTAISIVMLIQVVGVILVMAMLTIPASIANLFTTRMSYMMWIAVLLSGIFVVAGTFMAYHLDWPLGATIALLAGFAYVLALLLPTKRLAW